MHCCFMQDSVELKTVDVGTSRWKSPEVVAGKADYSLSSDVYSFGNN